MSFNWTEDEIAIFDSVKDDKDKAWKRAEVNQCKTRFKTFHLDGDNPKCCYCAKLFIGEFRMVIDIEHILPKSKYPDLTFNLNNLAIACKRCNMDVKKIRTDFLVNHPTAKEDYFKSMSYKFIHPNIDNYNQNINIHRLSVNGKDYIKYFPLNDGKGKYTYEYFRLSEIEIDTFNQVQGGSNQPSFNDRIRGNLRNRLLTIIGKI